MHNAGEGGKKTVKWSLKTGGVGEGGVWPQFSHIPQHLDSHNVHKSLAHVQICQPPWLHEKKELIKAGTEAVVWVTFRHAVGLNCFSLKINQ